MDLNGDGTAGAPDWTRLLEAIDGPQSSAPAGDLDLKKKDLKRIACPA
jgi:hypothetical protein